WPDLDEHARRVADTLRCRGRAIVPILVGGYAAKSAADIVVASPWLTAVCDGDGEHLIVDIARAVARRTLAEERHRFPGLCFVDAHGQYHGSTAARVRDLDPYDQYFGFVHVPAVHDMDIFRDHTGRQLKTAQLFTQRGCPWACGFCNKSTEGNAVVRL